MAGGDILIINPYRPGAGLMPIYLSGRETEIKEVDEIMDMLLLNIPVQSVIYSGLRGVGKTVLLNKIEENAREKGIFCRHIEVGERKDFVTQIASCAQVYLRTISMKEKFKTFIQKSLDAIKSLVISFNPDDKTFSVSMQEKELYMSANLSQSMTDVFVSIGEIAYKTQNPICFFIDEIQYMKQDELGASISAIHRTNQLGYPVMIIGAGLPKIYKMLSDARSYAERLFIYRGIGALDSIQSRLAITEPAQKANIKYSDDAIEEIISITDGYPYFIQQFCQIICQSIEKNDITIDDVNNSTKIFWDTLDNGFFKVRYERCSDSDKKFVFAMVQCRNLPCLISDVAKNMNKSVSSISTARAQLINKGIIYAVKYRELDFTVPKFAEFIKRTEKI